MDQLIAMFLEQSADRLDGKITVALGTRFAQRRVVVIGLRDRGSGTVAEVGPAVEHIIVERCATAFDGGQRQLRDLCRVVTPGKPAANLRKPSPLQFRNGAERFRLVLGEFFNTFDQRYHVIVGIFVNRVKDMGTQEQDRRGTPGPSFRR